MPEYSSKLPLDYLSFLLVSEQHWQSNILPDKIKDRVILPQISGLILFLRVPQLTTKSYLYKGLY